MCVSNELLKCYQMPTETQNDVSQEDLRLPQLSSPPWSDDDNVDTPRQSTSPSNIDRSTICCVAFLCILPNRQVQVFRDCSVCLCCLKRLKSRIALNGTPMTVLRDVTCSMGSRSVTCYPTQVNVPLPNPSPHVGTRFTYPRGLEG